MKFTLIRCEIALAGRWAVTGIARANDEVDQPVMRDPRSPERPYLPTPSLAGSLRDHLGLALSTVWLGNDIGEREVRGSSTTRGRLRMLGTRSAVSAIDHRGTTAIASDRGAAESGALRTEETTGPTTVTVIMEHDGEADAALITALTSWRPDVGRGRSTGLGRARLAQADAVTVNLDIPEHLTWWLGARADYLVGQGGPPAGMTPTPIEPATIHPPPGLPMRVVEPLHVGSDNERGDNPIQPILRCTGRGGRPYIPGSSWKGVFRHRLTFILDAVGASPTERKLIVGALFGHSSVGRGVLRFHDSDLVAEGSVTQTHVAIDRFTGGAREGSLFTFEAVPRGVEFTLTIEGQEGLPTVGNMLDHVLRDLSEGLIGVGGHGSRGYGWIETMDTGDTSAVRPVVVGDVISELGLSPAAGRAENDSGATARPAARGNGSAE